MARSSRSSSGRRPLRGLVLGILIALALGAVVVQSAPGLAGVVMPVRASAGDLLASGASGERSPEPGIVARLMGHGEMQREIQALEARVQELSRYEAAARSMAKRLEAYEDMLNAPGEPPQRGATGRVIMESGGPFSETLLANVGRAHGVEPNWVAVNSGGLVGRVTHLGEHSSRILMVTDYNSRVPVMGENSGVRAIVFGENGMGNLSDRPEADAFLPGERVLTSGEGGVFPPGLTVGQVVPLDGGWGVAFSMAETRGGFVRLIPPLSIPAPEAEPLLADDTLAEAALQDSEPVQ